MTTSLPYGTSNSYTTIYSPMLYGNNLCTQASGIAYAMIPYWNSGDAKPKTKLVC
jgi:hypothetical protein